MNKIIKYFQKGFSVIEVLLAVSVFVLLITIFVGAFLFGQESSLLSGKRNRAVFLAEEGLEATRNIRDSSFSNLSDGTFGLATSSNQWIFSGSQDITDIFTRNIVISPVDADRKQVVSNVSWQQNSQRVATVSLLTYLTNWVTSVSGMGGWNNPQEEASLDLAGINDGWKVQTSGDYAYLVRYAGTPDFYVIDVSNTITPTSLASLGLAGDLRNIFVSGNFAYVASTSNNTELEIVDISTPSSPSNIGNYDASGTADAQGVFVSGSTAYLVRSSSAANEFVIINVSTPSTPTLIGSVNLGATGYEVFVSGNFAYVASSLDTQELIVVNISTPATPSVVASLDLTGTADGLTITGFDNTIVLGRSDGNFHVINVSTPTSPILLGTFNASAAVNDSSVDNSINYAFIATDYVLNEFQVIDISTPTTPTLFGSLNLLANLNGVAYNFSKNRVFGASDFNLGEFVVISPR